MEFWKESSLLAVQVECDTVKTLHWYQVTDMESTDFIVSMRLLFSGVQKRPLLR